MGEDIAVDPGMRQPARRLCLIDRSRVFGGAERSLVTLLKYLDRRRFEPIIVVDRPLEHHAAYEACDCEVIHRASRLPFWSVSERWKSPIRGTSTHERGLWSRRLRGVLRRTCPAIVHLNVLHRHALDDLLTVKNYGASAVGHVRVLQERLRLTAETLGACDAVICISDLVLRETAQLLENRGPQSVTTLKRVYNPIEPINLDPRAAVDFRRHAGIPAEADLLVSVGQIEELKGHGIVLESFLRISNRFPNLRLAIVGGVAPLDKRSQAWFCSLKARVKQLGLEQRVHFTGHVVNVDGAYAAATIVVSLTLDGEAFGRVPIEATMAGTPVVAAATGATPEIVDHGVTGLLVPPRDATATAKAITVLLGQPEKASRLVTAGRTAARARFDPITHARQVGDVYDSVLPDANGSDGVC